MDLEQLQRAIEAILFAAGERVELSRLAAVLELCKTNSVSLEDDVNGDNPNVRLLETPERKEEPDGI